jgi:WD40 repeat protein/serine/threonine protein kinase
MTNLHELVSASGLSGEQTARVLHVLEGYLSELEAGAAPHRDELLARHPDLADLLVEYLDKLDQLHEAAVGLRAAPPAGDVPVAPLGEHGRLGDFDILREVGRGGMGIVYEAEQISLGRRVALKVLPFAATLDPRQLQRFHNEARAAASLHHEHIVPVYAVGCERAVHFYAMQFIEGQSLAELIARQRAGVDWAEAKPAEGSAATAPQAAQPTSPAPGGAAYSRRAAELIAAAADALEHAHSLGVVHRDVKPANLMLDAHGKLWVTDFGLARFGADAGLTMSGDLLGTLRYMSPEQALAKHGLVDHRTDVYALGATLYELLTLRPAVDGRDREEVLRKIAFAEPTPPRQIDHGIPADLETIALKALEKNPAERYATARELADDLRRFLNSVPIHAKPPTLRQRIGKWAQRHRPMVLVASLFLLLAVVGLTAGIILIAQERDATLERERALRRLLYVQNVHLAHEAWQAGDLARMSELLDRDKSPPAGDDPRGFEWHYLKALLDGTPRVLACEKEAHKGGAYCVTWAPDGRTLVSCGNDGFVRLWEPETLALRAAWPAHDGKEVNIALFSPPDGRGLATASDDHTVRLWTLPEQTLRVPPLGGHGDEVGSMAFAPDGKTLAASGRDGVVRLWDVATGQVRERLDLKAGLIHMLTFSPDGQTLAAATARGGGVLLDVGPLRRRTAVCPEEEVRTVTFSPDRSTLAVGLSWSGEIRLVEAASHRTLAVLRGHLSNIRLASFSPDGKRLASCGDDGKLHVWDARTGRLCSAVNVANDRVSCATWSPDGTRLATADGTGGVNVYDMTVPQARRTFPLGPVIVAFRDASRLRAVLPGDRLWELDVLSLRSTERALPPRTWHAAASQNQIGTRWHDCQVELWDVGREESLQTECHGGIRCVDRSPDGRHLALSLAPSPSCHHFAEGDAARPPAVWLWDVTTGEKHNLGRLDRVSQAVALSPDGKCLAVGDGPRVRVIDVATREVRQVLDGHRKDVMGFVFSPDGRLLASGGADRAVCIWDLSTGRERYRFFRPAPAQVGLLSFSPDGKTLVGGDSMGKVVLWHVATGQELMTLDEYPGSVASIAFSPDGMILATSGNAAGQERGFVTLCYGAGGAPAGPLK